MVEQWSEKPCVTGSIPVGTAFYMYLLNFINKLIEFIISCFLRGLLVIAPFLLTTYIVKTCLDLSKQVLGLGLPNYWILIFVFIIFLCGYFTKNIVVRFFYGVMELIILRIPGINFVYTSFKDLTSAFVDRKIKFDKPVLIGINAGDNEDNYIKKIGFITAEDLGPLSKNNEVAVFVPQSFSLMVSGELMIVPKDRLIPIDNVDSKNLFKLVVSGGFINILNK